MSGTSYNSHIEDTRFKL